jgi:tellurite resistance protein
MDPRMAEKVCELVAGLTEADGERHPAERTLLRRIMARLGLSTHGDHGLVPTLKGGEAARAMAALPEDVRQEALELLVEAAIVDGKVVPAEQRYLAEVAGAMGLAAEQLARRVADRLAQG